MTFSEAVSDGFSKYATFSGRTSRSGYWWFYLFYVLVLIGASIIDAVIKIPLLTGLAALALFLPSLAILVRRLHDTDHSGWWILISFIPIVGTIVILVFACTASGPPNQYGDGPDETSNLTVTAPPGQAPPPPGEMAPPRPEQGQETEPPAGDPPAAGPTA